MKRIIYPLIAVLLILSSCATLKLENYRTNQPKVLYENNFSSTTSGFTIVLEGKLLQIENNSLHFLSAAGDVHGAHASLDIPFGNNSFTSFMLKLGKKFNPGHPCSHINFLWIRRSRICILFDQSGITGFTEFGDEFNHLNISSRSLKTNEWYHITVFIQDYEMTIFIDGKRLKPIKLDDRLSSKGHLVFECHQEMWIDDVKVTEISSFEFAKK